MFRLLQRARFALTVFVFSIMAAAVLTLVWVPTDGGSAAASGTNTTNPLGVYVGYQAPGAVSSFGRSIGQQPSFAMDFLDGDSWSAMVNTAPSYMSAWRNSGDTMIWGIPMLPNAGPSGGYTLAQGASGAYNSYFLKIAQDMVAGGEADSIVRPGWEFNGGWFSWAANGQAAAFIGYWQQIVNTMRSVPGEDFTFEWNPTAGDEGVGNLANYYPGTAYVDYIGLDVYDESFGRYAGIASQWNTYLTEPYGLDWLASFAKTEGKPITLPEWGLGWGPANDGGVLSDAGNSVGGGDDPTFIEDMAQWIAQNNVYEATFWQYGSSLLSGSSNPNSDAAFISAFGSGSSTGAGGSSTTSTTTAGSGSSGGGGGGGGGGQTSSSGGAWTPSLPSTNPGSGDNGSSVTIQDPIAPVSTWRGAHFSAVVTSVASGKSSPSGSARWGITSASGAAIPCRSGSNVVRRGNGMTRCNVGPGQLSAADGPYTVAVSYPGSAGGADSSASVTQPVDKGTSRIRVRTVPVVQSGAITVVTASVVGLPISAGTATGTVTFAIVGALGATLECAGGDTVSLVSGQASCDTTAADSADSPYAVTATYSGDSTFGTSGSLPRTIRVR